MLRSFQFFHRPRCVGSLRRAGGLYTGHPYSGLTLVEMLIGMTITLVLMAAVVNLFASMGEGVRNRRATIEMSGLLRMVRLRLHNDLVGATCPTLTWQRPGDNNGYLEISEGGWSDRNPSVLVDGIQNGGNQELDHATSLVPRNNLVQDWDTDNDIDENDQLLHLSQPGSLSPGGLGDYDDILALTVRSEGEPFVGRRWNYNTGVSETIESPLAEVVWFAVENPADGSLGEPGMRTLYRRVLLIAPWLPKDTLPTPGGGTIQESLLEFYGANDISVRVESGQFIANALGDLTRRENRYGHVYSTDASTDYEFPHVINERAIRSNSYDFNSPPMADQGTLRPFGLPFHAQSEERQGEDIMLSDLLAFDVRVYDPGAENREIPNSGVILEPGDVGWGPNVGNVVSYGAYVDLGWHPDPTNYTLAFPGAPRSLFFQRHQVGWHPKTPGVNLGQPAVYDTWSFHYENDGIAQDSAYGIDQGTNGLDDDGVNGVDDMGERETAPPYDVPLRGVQITLRVYEPDTRNIRETSVTRSFVP